jgi:nitrate/TMAO reductase-like tetraheme cytochrome c subunit
VSIVAFWGKKKNGKIETEIENGTETSNENKKKPGLMRRLWRKVRNIDWKNPVNRWKLLFVMLFAFIALLGSAYGVVELTSTPTFCKTCHEMAPEYQTFQASAHNQISCVQCHVEPGIKNELVHKVESLKEVYYHVVGVPNPIAQTVPVMKVNCGQCHSDNRLVSATGDIKVNHKGHIKEGIPCITCHSGVVHAKAVERGLNTHDTYDLWTKENAPKLMNEKFMKPNMGTCIDCHDKVNKGEKPWKDIAYSLPENTHGTVHSEKKDSGTETDAGTVQEGHSTEAVSTEDQHKLTQDIILQAIGKQKTDVKLSMECFTCHKEISTPKTHQQEKWNQGHGDTAITDLDKCVNCHQDTKWIKKIPKQDIMTVLKTSSKKEKYVASITVVREESRNSSFCNACHADRPPGHADSDTWLTAHSKQAKTNDEKARCYVCHDREKPAEGTTDAKAPTDVYCQFCHRTGFKDEKAI